MRKLKLLIPTVAIMLSLTACSSASTEDTTETITEDTVEEVVIEESSTGTKPGGEALSDGTLEFSQLDETELTLVGIWENGDKYLAIRERALSEDMEYDGFSLDIICGLGFIDEFGDDGFKITRTDTVLVEEEGMITVTDTHDCVEYIETEELVYDPETDTITVSSYVDGEPGYVQVDDGRFEFDEGVFYDYQFVFSRTDKDIDSVEWDWYYEASSSSYDPR